MEILRLVFLHSFHWAVLGLFSALGYGIWDVSQKAKKGEPIGRGEIRYLLIFTIIGFVYALIIGLYRSL